MRRISTWRRLTALIALVSLQAFAQGPSNYPSRAVTVVVTTAPGTAGDIVMRAIQGRLSERLKQPLVVENRVGASGALGADYVAKSAPDGYTLAVVSNAFGILPSMRNDLPFNFANDFVHITKLVDVPLGFAVAATVKANDLKELFAQVKANPGKFTFASPGTASPQHLAGELMKQRLGLDMVHVPHKDHALAVQSIVGGHVDLFITGVNALIPQANAGRIRLLGVTGTKRFDFAPGIPNFVELGYDFLTDLAGWYILSAPVKTPPAAVARLNRELREALAAPEVGAILAKSGLTADTTTPEDALAFLRKDIERWAGVIKQGKIGPS